MKWISVKDKPPINTDVLICINKTTGDWRAHYWTGKRWELTPGMSVENVSHWMPLPKPPKQ